jgi:hypothetical protein
MTPDGVQRVSTLGKFQDPQRTAKGEPRAVVALERLRTLWFNTGTLCNITCANCYIESSPANDRLAYLTRRDVAAFLSELDDPACLIGFTGGEPFLNPEMIGLVDEALGRGHRVLVLTNAMRPMMRPGMREGLRALSRRDRLTIRVSLDAPDAAAHDAERGAGAFAETVKGIDWLAAQESQLAIAGRLWGRTDTEVRDAFAALIATRGWPIAAADPEALVLFPEMDAAADPPEISEACWGILGKRPSDVMCASSRMVVRRRGAERASVVSCTLLPYEPGFDLGSTLAEAGRPVALNHKHCATFCVLGGGACSA